MTIARRMVTFSQISPWKAQDFRTTGFTAIDENHWSDLELHTLLWPSVQNAEYVFSNNDTGRTFSA